MTLSGAVLVGGASLRMGRDKATLRLGGETMTQRQARVLRRLGVAQLFLVDRPGSSRFLSCPGRLTDHSAARGPLAAILAALTANASSHLAVVAVDLPAMKLHWWRWLLSHCGPSRGAVAQMESGFEPLAAIYPCEVLPSLLSYARSQRFDLQGFLASSVPAGRMRALSVPSSDRPCLFNCNHPSDLKHIVTPLLSSSTIPPSDACLRSSHS